MSIFNVYISLFPTQITFVDISRLMYVSQTFQHIVGDLYSVLHVYLRPRPNLTLPKPAQKKK